VKGLTIHPPAGSRSAEEDGHILKFLSRGVADIMRKMAPPARKPRGRPKGSNSTLLQCSRMHFCRLVQLYRLCSAGLTGLTYQMLGLLPDKATSNLFKLMERMWGAKHVPEFWKLKGLIGLPKTKVVTGVNRAH
jgi:hypothetical protein